MNENQQQLQQLRLFRMIHWNSPENTKPQTSRWHRNHEAVANWYHRWWIEFTIVGPPPEEHYYIDSMMQTIEVPTLQFRKQRIVL